MKRSQQIVFLLFYPERFLNSVTFLNLSFWGVTITSMKTLLYLVLLSITLAFLSGGNNFSAVSHALNSATRVFNKTAGSKLRNAIVRQSFDTLRTWEQVEEFFSSYTNKRDDELCHVTNTEALDECCYRTCNNNHICARNDGILYDSCHEHTFQLPEDCLFRNIECCVTDACNQEKCSSYEYLNNWRSTMNFSVTVCSTCRKSNASRRRN